MKAFLNKYFKATETNDVEIRKTTIKGRLILKILALISAICFFIPLCTVSCSGQTAKINGIKATFGFQFYGQKIDGNLSVILLVVLPIAMVLALSIKYLYLNKYIYIAVAVSAIINVGILLRFKTKVIETVNYYSSKVEFDRGFYINIIINLLLLVISLLIVAILYLDQIVSIVDIKKATSQYQYNYSHRGYPSSTSEIPTSIAERNCLNCGVILKPEDIYCMQCGTKYKIEEGNGDFFCLDCGAEIMEGSNFCNKCGKKF